MNKKSGVSVLALSVAIVIMAILATTAIMSLEETGVVDTSKIAVRASNKDAVAERLEVLKNTYITNHFGNITINKYVEMLIDEGEIVESAIVNADGSQTVKTVTDYIVTLIQDGEANLIIDVEGLNKTNKPEFDMTKLSSDETSITVDTTLSKGVYVEYTYSYKLHGASTYIVANSIPTKSKNYKIKGLASRNTYDVQIVATNPYGTTSVVYTITTK